VSRRRIQCITREIDDGGLGVRRVVRRALGGGPRRESGLMMVGDGAGFHSGDWRDAFCARYERQAMTSAGVFGVHFSCRRKEFGLALSLARSDGPGSVFAPGLIGAGPSANSERFFEMVATGDHDARVGGHDRCAAAARANLARARAL